jgi:hypothetical protein
LSTDAMLASADSSGATPTADVDFSASDPLTASLGHSGHKAQESPVTAAAGSAHSPSDNSAKSSTTTAPLDPNAGPTGSSSGGVTTQMAQLMLAGQRTASPTTTSTTTTSPFLGNPARDGTPTNPVFDSSLQLFVPGPKSRVKPLDPIYTPTANNDSDINAAGHAYYIAREHTSAADAAFYNVSADAGVQANDLPGLQGDTLISHHFTAVPTAGTFETFNTPHGSVNFMTDGSFNYLPAVGFLGTDMFTYMDTEVSPTGVIEGTSSAATVYLHVTNQPTAPLGPGGAVSLDATSRWAKFHNTTDNQGTSLVGTRNTTASVLAAPHLSFPVQGSPVVGQTTGGTPEVFVENDSNLVALSPSTGATLWTSTNVGASDNAPAVVNFAGSGPTDWLITATTSGQVRSHAPPGELLVINGDTGVAATGFVAQESFTDGSGTNTNLEGSAMSSPTVVTAAAASGNPAFNGVVFGVDVPNDTVTYSRGRLYALRTDGTVAWENLLAGHIHGSPLFVPPSTDGTNPDGFIYVGTDNNGNWGGRPLSTPTGGRFYKIDALTGQVVAEMFAPTGAIDGSALLVPHPGVNGDATGTGAAAQIVFTDHAGQVFSVTQAVLAPPTGIESPTLTVSWQATVGTPPTSPALSVNKTTLYIGDNQGMRALAAATGTQVWDVTGGGTLGAVVGSPAVVQNAGVPGQSEVIFGTNGAPSGIYDILDTGISSPPIVWQFIALTDASGFSADFGLSSPAIGRPIQGAGNNFPVFIGSKEGGFFTIV